MPKSKMKDHTNLKSKKQLVPPLLNMGDLSITLRSWSKERMPEYIWLGLLRDSDKRENFFEKVLEFKSYIQKNNININFFSFSNILKLTNDEKDKFFKAVLKIFPNVDFDCLCVVSHNDPKVREHFYNSKISNDERIEKLRIICEKMYDRYSEISIDIRFVISIIWNSKLFIHDKLDHTIEAIKYFPLAKVGSEKYREYSVMISAFEVGISGMTTCDYSEYFYKEMYLMDSCNPMVVEFAPNDSKNSTFDNIKNIDEIVENLKTIKDDSRIEVVCGLLAYIKRICLEIINSDLEESIIARLGIRTIMEIYVNIKYMNKAQLLNANIWDEFKEYGIGKLKKVYKISEENNYLDVESSHKDNNYLKLLTNEFRSEEFIPISYSNFDEKPFRNKFIDVDEKNLYDTLYNYDTSFTHGNWGSIIESVLLLCDNSLHNYHRTSDMEGQQKLKSVSSDLNLILVKLINYIKESVVKEYNE